MRVPVRKTSWDILRALRYLSEGHTLSRLFALLVAVASACAGLALAWHHPLSPTAAAAAFVLWSIAVVWRGHLWLVVVPAGVAFMNFSPWTGWVVFDEFDILLLGTLTGGYARRAWTLRTLRNAPEATLPTVALAALLLLGGMALWALWRAMMDAGGLAFDWFAGYTDALNSLRVVKSEGYALLCMPLLHREIARGSEQAHQRIAAGMVLGLCVVVLAVLWERLAFTNLFDFSKPYRTVGLFWEMHVGGEAIDAYLAMATPFAAWAVISARRPLPWIGAAALSLMTGYAVLTTFSRGLYFAVTTSLLLLAVLLLAQTPQKHTDAALRHQPRIDWRKSATFLLWVALSAEVLMVLAFGSFMLERMDTSQDDFRSRVIHWQRGLALLQSNTDWLLGKGPGRLPTHYAEQGPDGEFSGEIHAGQERHMQQPVNHFVTVVAPRTQERLGGQFALTQRVYRLPEEKHVVRMDIRTQKATDVQLEWCARHLLYDAGCQTAQLHIEPGPTWQTLVQPLTGETATAGPWYAPRLALFTLSVVNAGGRADIDNLQLQGPHMDELLTNGDFSEGLAHWLGAAQSYFLPWHIDNLFLELLIERGLSGLLIFCALVGAAMWRLVWAHACDGALHPYMLATLAGALCVGLTGSLIDVPRVMFLFYIITLDSALFMPSNSMLPLICEKSTDKKIARADSTFRRD